MKEAQHNKGLLDYMGSIVTLNYEGIQNIYLEKYVSESEFSVKKTMNPLIFLQK